MSGAVPAPEGSVDAGVPWHYGDPFAEQRALSVGRGAVDLSHRGVVTVSGPDRLEWLHSLTTQHLLALNGSTTALILSPHGHVEHELHLVDDGTTTWITVEPGTQGALAAYLDSMRFMLRVDIADVTSDFGVVWEPVRTSDMSAPTWLIGPEFAGVGVSESGSDRGGDAAKYIDHRPAHLRGREVILPRDVVRDRVDASGAPAGTWALEALRVAAGVPRLGFETDHRTLPHEVGWIGPAVHLAKGCYRGQEAVARVHNLGRPPRRLVLLHLDGSDDIRPAHGDPVAQGEREIGWVASSAQHFELGPIATAVLKSRASDDDVVVRAAAGVVSASQERITA